MIFLFWFPLGVPVVDLTTERRYIWKVSAYSSPTFITTLDTVARSSVINTDGTKYRSWNAVFMWTKPLVNLRKKMVQNWNCDSSSKVFKGIRCWYVCSVTLMTTCPWHWWCSPHLITHFRDSFKPRTVGGVNILSDLLEGWCQSLDLRHCLNYVFSLLLKARCEAPEIL